MLTILSNTIVRMSGGKDIGTEQLIKETARRVFFIEGKLHATTQDIADAAGINRPSLHYYFRSKNDLIREVHDEAKGEMVKKLKRVFGSDLPFREKIELFIDAFFEHVTNLPYLQLFLINEINCKSGESVPTINRPRSTPAEIRKFLEEIAMEMEKGTIRKCSPENFLINMFSLVSYPIIMKPMYIDFFERSSHEYDLLMEERKKMILDLLFNP